MEGLIPLVYRTLKKNKTRRQYQCLSSGAAQTYNIADFDVDGQSPVYMKPSTAEKSCGLKTQRNGHRRHVSMGDFSMGYSSADGMKTGASPTPPAPKLKRFRSHRMFSCVTGA
ncbi:PREDICTED: uncharacterized protein LOC18597397 [Theobroma cacao]|uniref:Uncharacterized protein LOC18597397 n=1 Tax=Theobroma cacao TaxID=3641 RepID=A0AB32WAE0_THECC|nr:PREDICTED: uncharacterized protein LOC18597397 [Theobroma cacao]